jgi:hypothetical protein
MRRVVGEQTRDHLQSTAAPANSGHRPPVDASETRAAAPAAGPAAAPAAIASSSVRKPSHPFGGVVTPAHYSAATIATAAVAAMRSYGGRARDTRDGGSSNLSRVESRNPRLFTPASGGAFGGVGRGLGGVLPSSEACDQRQNARLFTPAGFS